MPTFSYRRKNKMKSNPKEFANALKEKKLPWHWSNFDEKEKIVNVSYEERLRAKIKEKKSD